VAALLHLVGASGEAREEGTDMRPDGGGATAGAGSDRLEDPAPAVYISLEIGAAGGRAHRGSPRLVMSAAFPPVSSERVS